MLNEKTNCMVSKNGQTPVALKNVAVECEINDVVSTTRVKQTYLNDESVPIEVVYCFPIEQKTALNSLSIKFSSGREIKAVAEEKGKAFKLYDDAIEAGDGAFIMDEQEKDIYTLSAGNLKPGEEVEVVLEYHKVLDVFDGIIRLQIPTTISPRYIPKGYDPVKADKINPPLVEKSEYGLNLSVKIYDTEFKTIDSPSHPVKINRGNDCVEVRLSHNDVNLDRDFILEYEPAKAFEPVCLIGGKEDKVALLRFYPELNVNQEVYNSNNEIVFIVDCSGSMSGTSIQAAKRAMEICLRTLNSGDKFNIFKFGSNYTQFSTQSLTYDKESFTKGLEYINNIDADMGGTELMTVLTNACESFSNELPKNIVLITDGQVGNEEAIIKKITAEHKDVRFFTFGIGYGASHRIIQGLAENTLGASEMIQPGERIEPKIIRQFARISQPILSDVKIEVVNGKLDIPKNLPYIYSNDSFTIFAKVDLVSPETKIFLHGKLDDTVLKWSCQIKESKSLKNLPVLWAADKIKRISHSSFREQIIDSVTVKELALKYNLISSETSFVGIEKRSEDEKTFNPEYRRIPIAVTKDYGADVGFDASCHRFSSATKQGSILGSLFGGALGFFHTGCHSGAVCEGLIDSRISRNADRMESYNFDYSIKETKAPKQPWYIKLMLTQSIEGNYECKTYLAEVLGISTRELSKILQQTAVNLMLSDVNKASELLLTIAAYELIKRDNEAAQICQSSILKAKRWIDKELGSQKIYNDFLFQVKNSILKKVNMRILN